MDKTIELRDLCLQGIRKEFTASGMAVAELTGNHFAGVDIALKNDADIGLYRITVIKHNQERRFE